METTIPWATTAPAAAPAATTLSPSFRVAVSFWRAPTPAEGPIVRGVLYFRCRPGREEELLTPPLEVCRGQIIRVDFRAGEDTKSLLLPVERDGRFFLSAVGTREGQFFAEIEPRELPPASSVPDALRLGPPGAEEPERFDEFTGGFGTSTPEGAD